jgi:hypothetical protein
MTSGPNDSPCSVVIFNQLGRLKARDASVHNGKHVSYENARHEVAILWQSNTKTTTSIIIIIIIIM